MCSNKARMIYYVVNGIFHLLLALTCLIIAVTTSENTSCESPVSMKEIIWTTLAFFMATAIFSFSIAGCCADVTSCILGINVSIIPVFYLMIIICNAISMFNKCQTFNQEFNSILWNTSAAMFSVAMIFMIISAVSCTIMCCNENKIEHV